MRERGLALRLALWIGLSTALSLVVFGAVAGIVATLEEREEVLTGAVEDHEADIRREVLTALVFAAPVALSLAVGASLWLTRRALAPIDRVIAAASEISTERLDRRLPVPERDDELRALVIALNAVFARLERGHEALSLFAADASHEMRTPLSVIGNELEVALRRPRSTAEWEAAARTSLVELRRLTKLIDALLRLTRADATIVGERVDLLGLIEQVLAAHAAAAEQAGVALGAPIGEPADVHGDPEALASALSNIVANSIRYTPRGGSLAVELTADDGTATVVFDDTGPGIAESELTKIFAPFARGRAGCAADTAADSPGLGLGLAVARRIVERHGGSITAAHAPTGGARFLLTLPLRDRPLPG